jgi:hypothetical protein
VNKTDKRAEKYRQLTKAIEGRFELIDYMSDRLISNDRVILKCPTHGDGSKFGNRWVPLASSIINGYGCPKCAGKYIYTPNEWIKLIEEKGFKFKNFIGEFKGSQSKLNLICNIHGEGELFETKWQPSANNIVNHSKGCPKCKKTYKRTLGELIELVNNTKYEFICLKSDFKSGNTRIAVGCPEHGPSDEFATPWVPRFEEIARGNGCPKCANLYNFSLDEYKEQIENKTPYKVLLFDDKKKSKHTKIVLLCPEHGYGHFFRNPWTPSINNILRGGRCPKCTNSYVYTIDEIIDRTNEVGKGKFKLLGPITNFERGVKSRVLFQCLKDEAFTWETNPDCIFSGTSCPHCAESGFNSSKPAYFYLQELYSEDKLIALKLGITNREPIARMQQQSNKTLLKHILLNYIYHDDGNVIYQLERHLIKKFKKIQKLPILSKDSMPDGFSETVCISSEKEIIDEMKNISPLLL